MIERGGRPWRPASSSLLDATVAPLLASAFALVNERNGVSIPGELRSTTPMRGVAARRSLAMWASDE